MSKTKAQKIQTVEKELKNLKQCESVIFADFAGLGVNDLNNFRKSLKSLDIIFRVIKKRLLKIIFEKEGIGFEPKTFEGQAGVVFSPKNLTETASAAYRFSKNKDKFKILGGFDLKEKKFLDAEYVKMIGQLPSREILLAQLAGVLSAPIRMFLYLLSQKSKQTVEN